MNLPGGMELIIIFLVILLVFGAKRIPEIASGLGKGIREFKDATNDIKREMTTPAPPPPQIQQAAPPPVYVPPAPVAEPQQVSAAPTAPPTGDPYATPDPYAPKS